MSGKKKPAKRQNGKLKIELEPDEALRAALETPPPDRGPTKKLPRPRKGSYGS